MIVELAVRRWQLMLVLFFALCALGIHALLTIPKSEDPIFPVPDYVVLAVMPGATPDDLERTVVEPIETRISNLEQIKRLHTVIQDGVAMIEVEFFVEADADRKRDELLREVSALRPALPEGLARLEVEKADATKVNILETALVSETAAYGEIERAARSLKRRLEAVPGIGDVTIVGLPKQEVRVTLDRQRLAALQVWPTAVVEALAADSANVPGGRIEAGGRRFSVKTSGEFASLEAVGGTVVRGANGEVVRVRDVAQVALTDAEPTDIARFNGRRAVLVMAAQRANKDIFEVADAARAAVDAFAASLPKNIVLERGFDQSRNVAHRLSTFARDIGIAILLVLITLLPLGLRASFITMVSIPLSVATGLCLLQVSGFSVDQISIIGFVIALGLVVDDSVVVVENISRHLRAGLAPHRAAIAATREITASVLGCTATLIFAFVPLLALPGIAGRFIRGLPVALTFTILASLLVSLTIVPFLASRLLPRSEHEHGNVFLRVMTSTIERSYRPVLSHALRRPWLTLGVAAALLASAFALVPQIGFSVFPKAGTPQFMVQVETPPGSSLDVTDAAVGFVERTLRKHEHVTKVSASIGKGHPQIYYNVVPRAENSNVADVFAEADLPGEEARNALYRSLREALSAYTSAKLTLKEFENGPPLEAPIALRLLSEDREQLEAAAAIVERVIRDTPGTRDVDNPSTARRTDVRVDVDSFRAERMGIATPTIDAAIRLAVAGVSAGHYRDAKTPEPLDIRVTVPRTRLEGPLGSVPGIDVFDQLQLPTTAGSRVPFHDIARLQMETSPTHIHRHDRTRSVTVSAWVDEGYNTDRLTRQILGTLAGHRLPDGVRLLPAGDVENANESFGGLGVAFMVAAFGILAVLLIEFRTFRATLVVASVIPLGVVGGLYALFVTGYTLSFTACIGFVALMGIEVKNSILLVDFTNQLRAEGLNVDAAVQRAGEVRFVPILLTTATALGGLVPLALERSSLYSPLAVVIIGGLLSSTVLTRLVTPVVYKLLLSERNRREAYERDEDAPVPAELRA